MDFVKETVETIKKQFGWKSACVMIGVKSATYGEDEGNPWLSFAFKAKAVNKANLCRITYLVGLDLYRMEFLRVWGSSVKKIESFDGIYCDQLQELFEEKTRLYLHL